MIERNIQLIPINRFLTVVGLFTWLYIFPVYLKQLGATEFAVGLAYSFFNIGITMFQFPGGYLADIYKKKTLLLILQSLMPMIFICMGLVRSYKVLIALYFIYCVLASLNFPALSGLLANTSSKKNMGKAFSLFQAYFIMGFGLGPLLGYFLMSRGMPVADLFFVTAVFSLLSFLITLFWVAEEQDIRPAVAERTWKVHLDTKLTGLFLAGSFFFILMQYTLFSPLPSIFMADKLDYDELKINLIFAVGGFLAGVLSLSTGKYITEKSSPYFFFIAQVIHFTLIYLWVITGNAIMFVFGWMVIQLSMSSIHVMLAAASNKANRGKVIGLFGTITGLVPAFVPLALLSLKDQVGYSTLYLSVFPFIIVQYFIFRKFWKKS
ncbi:MFS transporter [bacterium]|nr:MFS transporter [bacterium]